MSTPPNLSDAVAIRRSATSGSPISPARYATLRPAGSMLAATCASLVSLRPFNTTLAPAACAALAASAPNPEPPPVMTTVLLLRLIVELQSVLEFHSARYGRAADQVRNPDYMGASMERRIAPCPVTASSAR